MASGVFASIDAGLGVTLEVAHEFERSDDPTARPAPDDPHEAARGAILGATGRVGDPH